MARVTRRDATVTSSFPIVDRAGLNVSLLGGTLDRRNTPVQIPKKALTLVDDMTNYVFIQKEGTEIESNTTGFPEGSKRLWVFITAGGEVVGIEDCRATMRQAEHTRFFTLTNYILDATFNANVDWTLLDLSALVPLGTKVVWLRFVCRDSGTPGAEVYFAARKPGETAYSQWMKVWPQIMGLWTNDLFPVGLDDNRKLEYAVKVSGTFNAKIALLGLSYGG